MPVVYHRYPEGLQGSYLHPLNKLRTKLPELYRREVQKYTGREHLMQQRVPLLECLWNDVLHFSPVHREQVAAAYQGVAPK